MDVDIQQYPVNTFVHRHGEEALSCRCLYKCCHFEGCCAKEPGRNLDSLPYVENYTPVDIPNTEPNKQNAGRSFLDLPAELRNKVYVQVVLSDEVIRMKLNPTIMDHGEMHQWGRDNAWAILGVCRRLYHEASSLAYKENYFQVWRGTHRDFSITKHPGMPYERIQFLHLYYPMETSPCSWAMDHMWSHWLQDVDIVRKHFPNLRRLFLKMGYEGFDPNTVYNYTTWAPLLFKGPGESGAAMLKRVTAVLRAMTQLHGRKMPQIVQMNFWGYFHDENTNAYYPPYHEPQIINKAILKVADPNINIEEYKKQSYPLHWVSGPHAIFYGNEPNPLECEMVYGPEPSEYESD
ncbi:hypothetical protein SLS60_006615 [Paraconiothyrium brasiliense]|uniref:Uncharacterized protein n=1 Tax=Paraconiothyrium brasiliense TaxID=300254 RepID=A0ABR3RB85_9PLEO